MRGYVDSIEQVNKDLSGQIVNLVSTDLNSNFNFMKNGSAAAPDDLSTRKDSTQIISETMDKIRYQIGSIENVLSLIIFNKDRIDEYLVEIYKKYSIPTACIVFVLIGAPLGIMSRRGGFGIAATLSLGFFLLYWSCLIGGEKLADRDIISPFIGMWGANIVIGIAGIYLTLRMGKETPTIDWSFFKRFVPKSIRGDEN
jgi:lipopolysaccharide export system permease protein